MQANTARIAVLASYASHIQPSSISGWHPKFMGYCMQALEQLLKTFSDAETLTMLLKLLDRAVQVALSSHQQSDTTGKALQALVCQLPALAAALDQTSLAQATDQQQLLQKVLSFKHLTSSHYACTTHVPGYAQAADQQQLLQEAPLFKRVTSSYYDCALMSQVVA